MLHALVLLFCTLPAGRAETFAQIVGNVSANSYSNWLNSIYTSDGNSRGFNHTGSLREPAYQHDLARDFIASNFQAMGYATYLDPFSFSRYNADYINCNNIIAIKKGQGGTNVYVIGAHYDSVDAADVNVTLCPGADDNGSSIAALLESARAIQSTTFRDTIILVAFDAEEKGFFGSEHFADNHLTDAPSQTNATTFLLTAVRGMVNADMIAHRDPSHPNQVGLYSADGVTDSPLHIALGASFERYTMLTSMHRGYEPYSDHLPFHNAGIDALAVSENDPFHNPYYHTDEDSVDTPGYIAYDYAASVTKGIVGYLCEQARAVPPAELSIACTSNATVQITWQSSPGVAYAVLGCDQLVASNTWQQIAYITTTNTTTELGVEFDVETSPQKVFKVLSE